MTSKGWEFVPEHRQLFDRTLGEALAKMVRERWPRDTVKHAAKAWDLDPSTAANLIKGHASERTITKALRAEGWDLLSAIGVALTGQTHHEWEEERLAKIIKEKEHAEEGIRSLRARREQLEAQAARLDGLRAGGVAGPLRGSHGIEGGRSDLLGARSAPIGSGRFSRAPETD
jgi:hypothetical protein